MKLCHFLNSTSFVLFCFCLGVSVSHSYLSCQVILTNYNTKYCIIILTVTKRPSVKTTYCLLFHMVVIRRLYFVGSRLCTGQEIDNPQAWYDRWQHRHPRGACTAIRKLRTCYTRPRMRCQTDSGSQSRHIVRGNNLKMFSVSSYKSFSAQPNLQLLKTELNCYKIFASWLVLTSIFNCT